LTFGRRFSARGGAPPNSLTHEVSQPLTAITNQLHACRRLAAIGNLSAAITARNASVPRQDVVQRIRDFVKQRKLNCAQKTSLKWSTKLSS
jgi:hypothetical protein